MAKLHSSLDADLRHFIESQHVFFVATAPSNDTGHLNLSPKGLDSLRVLGPRRVAYVDYTGSGIETVAHLRDDGRIVLLFCAFDGPPKILRLHGRGRALEPGDAEFTELAPQLSPMCEARSIIVVDVERIADSCGFGVPLYDYRGARDQLPRWVESKGAAGVAAYQRAHNAASIDGLPGLRTTARD